MGDETFDENDPWHLTANLVFGFCCNRCGAELSINDDWDDPDTDDSFLNACVKATIRAKGLGWVLVDPNEFIFHCPACASRRKFRF